MNIAARNDLASDRAWDDWNDFQDAVDDFDWSDRMVADDISDRLFDLARDPAWVEAQYMEKTAIGAIVRNAVNTRIRHKMGEA